PQAGSSPCPGWNPSTWRFTGSAGGSTHQRSVSSAGWCVQRRQTGCSPEVGDARLDQPHPGTTRARTALDPHMESGLRWALVTAVAPVAWGASYLVTQQWLPPEYPLWAAVIRALPGGLILLAV